MWSAKESLTARKTQKGERTSAGQTAWEEGTEDFEEKECHKAGFQQMVPLKTPTSLQQPNQKRGLVLGTNSNNIRNHNQGKKKETRSRFKLNVRPMKKYSDW